MTLETPTVTTTPSSTATTGGKGEGDDRRQDRHRHTRPTPRADAKAPICLPVHDEEHRPGQVNLYRAPGHIPVKDAPPATASRTLDAARQTGALSRHDRRAVPDRPVTLQGET